MTFNETTYFLWKKIVLETSNSTMNGHRTNTPVTF